MKTLLHQERSGGKVVTVTAHEDERFSIHVRRRTSMDIQHIAFQTLTRQQVLAMGLSRELERAGL